MKPTSTIESPNDFIVEDYTPGLSIDFRSPPNSTAVSRVRDGLNFQVWRSLSAEQLLSEADKLCFELGVSERPDDISESLRLFSGQTDALSCLTGSSRVLTQTASHHEPVDLLIALMKETGLLEPPPHWPVRFFCHDPASKTEMESCATHFGYVLSGQLELHLENQTHYTLHPRHYFCVKVRVRLRSSAASAIEASSV